MITLNALTKEQQQTVFNSTVRTFKRVVECIRTTNIEEAVETHRDEFTTYRTTIDAIINKNVVALVETSVIGMIASLYAIPLMHSAKPTHVGHVSFIRMESYLKERISDIRRIAQTEEELMFFGKSQFMFCDLNEHELDEAQVLMDNYAPYVLAMFSNIEAAPGLLQLSVEV
jgi:hypothetical protein